LRKNARITNSGKKEKKFSQFFPVQFGLLSASFQE
jgi:hypothetical protein